MTANKHSLEDERKINRDKAQRLRLQRKETHADMRLYLLKGTKERLNELAKKSKMSQTQVLEILINSAYDNKTFDPEE
ncbi:RepB family protein [Pantoea ananatis]|uniref:RepB family protein n=1 Tax=Pantoea ananas TaxID=553 RepID=UPI001B308E4C|nr:RepB family protein [Pantoea ananatis]